MGEGVVKSGGPLGRLVRLGLAAGVGALAFLTFGVAAGWDGWLLRSLVCGLAVGLSARAVRDVWAICAASVAAVALATAFACLSLPGGPPQLWPSAEVAAGMLAASVLPAALAAWLSARGRSRDAALVAVVLVVVAFLWAAGVLPGPQRVRAQRVWARISTEPRPESYRFDGDLFIRIDYLMHRGVPFYQAFTRAYRDDSRLPGPPPQLLNYRERWLFELWNLLPGPPGLRVWWAFVALACATCAAAFAFARRYVEASPALLAAVMLAGYLARPATSAWFPLAEYWGGCVAVFFLLAMAHRRWAIGAFLVILAVAMRELMLYLVLVYAVWWLFDEKRRDAIPGMVAVIAGPAMLLGAHWLWSPVRTQTAAGAARWLQGGPAALKADLQFSGQLTLKGAVTYLLTPVMALAGALQVRPGRERWWLVAAAVVPLVSLTLFSGGGFSMYWGAIMQPALMALAPLAVMRWMPAATA